MEIRQQHIGCFLSFNAEICTSTAHCYFFTSDLEQEVRQLRKGQPMSHLCMNSCPFSGSFTVSWIQVLAPFWTARMQSACTFGRLVRHLWSLFLERGHLFVDLCLAKSVNILLLCWNLVLIILIRHFLSLKHCTKHCIHLDVFLAHSPSWIWLNNNFQIVPQFLNWWRSGQKLYLMLFAELQMSFHMVLFD